MVSTTISVALFLLITFLAITFSKSRMQCRIEQQKGSISPGKISAWITIIIGLLFIAMGIYTSVIMKLDQVGVLSSVFGAVVSGFMTPSLGKIHDVVWNTQYVEGTSKLFGPTLGRKRTRIKWTDIIDIGETFTGYWYLQSTGGQKIYWSYLYIGNPAFAEAIDRYCPNISLSE